MEPHEIKPDTKLCTIIGMSAQVGIARKYFVKVFKHYNLNIAPIALNIKQEHLDITLKGLPNSKIQYSYIEPEYQKEAVAFCDNLDNNCDGIVDNILFILILYPDSCISLVSLIWRIRLIRI